MLQVYLVRHGETEWNAARRIGSQSDSPLTAMGEHRARLVAGRVSKEGITHIITSDLGRTRRTAQIIAEACGCEVICDPRLRELHMGVLEERLIDSLTPQEEQWRKQMVDGTPDGRIPQGESMEELGERMRAALEKLPDAAGRQQAAARQPWHRVGVFDQYGARAAGLCGTSPALAQLLTVARRSPAEPVAGFRLDRGNGGRCHASGHARVGRAAALASNRDQVIALDLDRRLMRTALAFG